MFFNMDLQNKGEAKTLLYLHSSQLDREYDKINILKIFETVFKRNTQKLIIVDFKQVLNIPSTKEGLYIETFLNGILMLGYNYLIID